jgi:DNA-binding beta-propeller fold protein YncE
MRKSLILVIGLFVILGCAFTEKRPDFSRFVWPKPPKKARVKLLEIIENDIDIRGRDTSEKLFGTEPTFAFGKPSGVAVDSGGRIYASDSQAGTVYIMDQTARSIVKLFESEYYSTPNAIALDEENGLVAVSAINTVNLYDMATKKRLLSIGREGDFTGPSGVAFDPGKKTIYIADSKKSEIYAYDYDGRLVSKIAETGLEPGEVYYPTGLATDREGRLYVVDTMNFRIQIFNPDGSLYKTFGKHGEGRGKFARPRGIAVSGDNLIIVTDMEEGNFQVFNIEGRALMSVGRSGSSPGRFKNPTDVFIDKNDKIYIVDQKNKRIQVFQLLSDRYYEEHPEDAADNRKH